MANWITLSEIKNIVGIESSYTQEDATLNSINASATKTLETLLGRQLTKQTHTEYLNSQNNSVRYYDVFGNSDSGIGQAYKEVKYYLKHYPVDPTDFEVHYQPRSNIDGSTQLDESEYILDAEQGILIITAPTISYSRGIKVVYKGGFEAATVNTETTISATIPADLKQAAIYQITHMYDKVKMSNINVRESRSQGSTNSSRFVNIHAIAPEAMAIIVQNKRRKFLSV